MTVFLDTHAAIFLWEGRRDVWGAASRDLVESAALQISPTVRLELKFLKEIGRLTVEPDEILGGLGSEWGLVTTSDRIEDVVALAMGLSWTRDPFDRLIVATADLHRAPLLTRDRLIHEHFSGAVW
jgi:PIN domain nuclease of toxin-antitoxin system